MEPPEGTGVPALDETARKALDRALTFIEYRSRSSGEVNNRLRRWNYDPRTRAMVISYLEDCGILDDLELARVFMGEMLQKQYGYHRVKDALLAKRIDRELVEQALTEYPAEEELARAVELARPLVSRLSGDEPRAARKKIVGYLTRRGYSHGTALEASRMTPDVDTQSGPELE